MKVIAFYLPQYHTFKENNEWWGEGFTEWTNLKKAQPLFENHYQPRIPLNKNYYNLLEDHVMEWQTKIAKENGVYGFCFYHYWFDGHMLMQKPMEKFLKNTNCDLNFCISWANEHWTKAWVSKSDTVLIEQKYGDEKQWTEHFNYFLQFFKDERYICEDNTPLLVIYRPELIDCLQEMLDCWTKLAKKNGFNGMKYAFQHVSYDNLNKIDSRFDYAIEYQPAYARREYQSNTYTFLSNIKRKINTFTEKNFNISIDVHKYIGRNKGPLKINYDDLWKSYLNRTPNKDIYIPGAFVDWDNTPRRQEGGSVFIGASPEKFKKYFNELVIKAKNIYKQDKIFIFAWNEWTEGGYLEPDEKYGYEYLKAIKNVLIENDEFPKYK
ncbi:MAG: glycoside hydrolase family 99-like domain-containing protein [Coprobacillus cateniformis]|nr:glycoside hydrolase family 99-like domain-containing protein [Coprobacillus cateniformis]